MGTPRRPCAPFRTSSLQPPASSLPAFTLIELLITMTIIAIISAAILGTASAAMEAGRRSRTESLITKINGLLLERWDSRRARDVNSI
jgi:prepilin-type N-terminal cleavage/methylation domain-containing protein